MSDNPFDPEKFINQDAIDALSDEQVLDILDMLTKAGY